MNQVGSDTCSGSTERMSDGNGSTADVGLLWIQTKSLGNSQVLRSERFIHLDKKIKHNINRKDLVTAA